MDFAEWIREQATKTYTENGAAARNTTGDARLDLFATIGSLRRADPERIELLFAEAYQADPLFALKILFYARDIREGLGTIIGDKHLSVLNRVHSSRVNVDIRVKFLHGNGVAARL